jgi:hypothetical protein
MAVARLTKGISPKHCTLPARRVRVVVGEMSVPANVRLLYMARGIRGFGDGFATIILPAYLTAIGYDPIRIGIVLTASLLGTAVFTLGIGAVAPRRDIRTLMLIGAALMVLTGLAFPNFQPRADIRQHDWHVRLGPEGDIRGVYSITSFGRTSLARLTLFVKGAQWRGATRFLSQAQSFRLRRKILHRARRAVEPCDQVREAPSVAGTIRLSRKVPTPYGDELIDPVIRTVADNMALPVTIHSQNSTPVRLAELIAEASCTSSPNGAFGRQ